MSAWKHRDSELDRTCGTPVPITRTDISGNVRGPFCEKCDGDVYRVEQPQRDPELAWLDRQEAAPEGTMHHREGGRRMSEITVLHDPFDGDEGKPYAVAEVEEGYFPEIIERFTTNAEAERFIGRREATPGGEDR